MTVASIFNLAAIVVTLAAVFGCVNHRWLRLPQSIGLVLIALVASFGALALDALFPTLDLRATVRETLLQIEFHDTLMKGMLSFLLFAGALHVDLEALLSRKWAISMLATVGTLISTSVVGLAMFQVFRVIDLDGLAIALPYCFVFGALISPTDPIAVLSILKQVQVPASLEAKIAGESLFNDGVGVVVFTILVTIAAGAGEHGGEVTRATVAVLFFQEAFGGAALGLVAGYLAYRAMQGINEHNLEVLITLALVMGAYAVASAIHVSGPIAMVIAGLFIGNHGTRFAMSEATRDHVDKFWSLLDEALNSVLFLAIGFEVLALTFGAGIMLAMAIAIPVVLLARLVAVATPIGLLGLRREFTKGAIPVLTWGGLRGGISVALALSLPAIPAKPVLLAVTYGVVVFSIIVQGLTIGAVARRTVR